MNSITKFFDQSVTGVTDKVMTTVSNLKRDFTRRSKHRKEKKEKKQQKKMQQLNGKEEDVEHKYKLVCDIPNCEYHIKPYEDFLNTLWSPKSNRSSLHSSQIVSEEEKSIEDKENFDYKVNFMKISEFNYAKDHSSDDSSSYSHDSNDNLADILNKDKVKLTVTNEDGQTTTVVGIDGLLLNNSHIQSCGKCMICFNKIKAPFEIMPCCHVFHKNCISHWLEIKSSCPLCNQLIEEKQIEIFKKRWAGTKV